MKFFPFAVCKVFGGFDPKWSKMIKYELFLKDLFFIKYTCTRYASQKSPLSICSIINVSLIHFHSPFNATTDNNGSSSHILLHFPFDAWYIIFLPLIRWFYLYSKSSIAVKCIFCFNEMLSWHIQTRNYLFFLLFVSCFSIIKVWLFVAALCSIWFLVL